MSTPPNVVTTDSPLERGPVWITLQFVINAFFRVWLGYRAAGFKPIEGEDGALILANHQSFLDPLVVGLPFRRPISFLARDSLFRAPVVGWILKNTHVMPINQQAASTASLRDTIKRLQDGWLVGIFPEGTRSPTGAIGQMKPGFAAIIRRAKHPVYPVGISGAYDALPLGGWFLKPARVRVVFGEPLTVEQLNQYSSRDQDQELVDLVHSRIAACYAAAEEWRRTGQHPA